jgi:hypothetical protein
MLATTLKVVDQMFLPIQLILDGGTTTPYCVVCSNYLIFGPCCEEDGVASTTKSTYAFVVNVGDVCI